MCRADLNEKRKFSFNFSSYTKDKYSHLYLEFLSCSTASPGTNSWTVYISRIPFLVQGTYEQDEIIYNIYT